MSDCAQLICQYESNTRVIPLSASWELGPPQQPVIRWPSRHDSSHSTWWMHDRCTVMVWVSVDIDIFCDCQLIMIDEKWAKWHIQFSACTTPGPFVWVLPPYAVLSQETLSFYMLHCYSTVTLLTSIWHLLMSSIDTTHSSPPILYQQLQQFPTVQTEPGQSQHWSWEYHAGLRFVVDIIIRHFALHSDWLT